MIDLSAAITDEDWLSALRPYQASTVQEMLNGGEKLENIAVLFLSKTGSENTAPFGTGGAPQNYFEAVKRELSEFVCGGDKYSEIRNDILSKWEKGKTYVAMAIAAAISPYVGIVATVLFPVIAIFLAVIANVGLNAWCSARAT